MWSIFVLPVIIFAFAFLLTYFGLRNSKSMLEAQTKVMGLRENPFDKLYKTYFKVMVILFIASLGFVLLILFLLLK